MKAISVRQFGGPEVLEITELPEPVAGWEQVVVQIEAAGVNPVDTYIRAGTYAQKPHLPYTPGIDGAGTVVAVGTSVKDFAIGQRVYLSGSLSGTYAERAVCGIAQVHALPDALTFAQGAAIGIPYATAHFALFARGEAKAGETVLVHGGTGGVGIAAIQLARNAAMTVFATGGSEAGRKLAQEQGACAVFDHSQSDYLAKIIEVNEGHGVNLIIEMLANENLGNDLALLDSRGRVVVIGSRGNASISPRDLMSRNADIRGVMLSAASQNEIALIHEGLRLGFETGILRPAIGNKFSLEEAAAAHQALSGSSAVGKVVLVP